MKGMAANPHKQDTAERLSCEIPQSCASALPSVRINPLTRSSLKTRATQYHSMVLRCASSILVAAFHLLLSRGENAMRKVTKFIKEITAVVKALTGLSKAVGSLFKSFRSAIVSGLVLWSLFSVHTADFPVIGQLLKLIGA
jgi:hypothetical protein